MVARQEWDSMKTFVFLIVAAILFVAQTLPALAQKEHIEFYKQFNEALEAGDFAAAEEAGERAWRTAETELGDSQTTAVLAYNYAAQIYFSTPEKAIEPLERVIEIAGEGSGLFGAEPPALMLAFVRAAANKKNIRLQSTLEKQLEQFDKQHDAKTALSARGWMHVAQYKFRNYSHAQARRAADSAVCHYSAHRESLPIEYINALLTRGISTVSGQSRSNSDLESANQDFIDAIDMFPPQKDIESFDPLFAKALAWHAATISITLSRDSGERRLGSRLTEEPPDLGWYDAVEWTTPNPSYEECDFTWKNRQAPEYPKVPRGQYSIGGVLLGYHTEGTKVVGARILAEVPEYFGFGKLALKAVENWELESPPTNPACARNRMLTIFYTLE